MDGSIGGKIRRVSVGSINGSVGGVKDGGDVDSLEDSIN